MSFVGLVGENSIEYIELLLKIWKEGDCAVLIDYRAPILSIINMLKKYNAKKCYIDKKLIIENDTENLDITFIKYNSYCNDMLLVPEYIYSLFTPNYSNNPAVVIFSSGTTGNYKGIMMSHNAINLNADMIIEKMCLKNNDSLYIIKKFSHSSTLVGELLVSLKTNIKLYIGPLILPPRMILKNIELYKISVICINPSILKLFIIECSKKKYSLDKLSKIYSSGDKLYLNDILKAEEVLPNIKIYNMYGLTEAGPRVTMQDITHCTKTSVGIPLKGVEIKIVCNNKNSTDYYEQGEVFVKTPCCAINYNYKDSNETAWIRTGDIGYVDENNELYIVNRLDDVILLNSHNIYPYFIENKMLELFQISDCVILKCYNKLKDKYVICCVYTGKKMNEFYIKNVLKDHLIDYEIPSLYFHFLEIPKNSNGKIDKIKLKKYIESKL